MKLSNNESVCCRSDCMYAIVRCVKTEGQLSPGFPLDRLYILSVGGGGRKYTRERGNELRSGWG
jgi:hypothetical protein